MKCGYIMIKYLLSKYCAGKNVVIDEQLMNKELSFYDFKTICNDNGFDAIGACSKKITKTPCIVLLRVFHQYHFVVVLKKGFFIKYLDIDEKVHYLPKRFFMLFYTHYMFYICC